MWRICSGMTLVCPRCNASITSFAKYCGICGIPFVNLHNIRREALSGSIRLWLWRVLGLGAAMGIFALIAIYYTGSNSSSSSGSSFHRYDEGDCVAVVGDAIASIGLPVNCGGSSANSVVLKVFDVAAVPYDPDFTGSANCPPSTTHYLYPSASTFSDGDRQFVCVSAY